MAALQFHEIADAFPLLQGAEFDQFKADIKENGVRQPIVMHEGKVLDGRNRYRAAQATGRKCPQVEWDGVGSPVAYVVSLNLRRRHMDESQRAMVAARLEKMFKEDAGKAKRAGNVKGGVHSGESRRAETKSPANLPTTSVEAREEAAKLMNVSGRSVNSASRVLRNGCDELVKAVESGSIAVSKAERISSLPMEEQQDAIEDATKQKQRRPNGNRVLETDPQQFDPVKARGVGINKAHEAIAILKSIPRSDPHRVEGYEIVARWIEFNKKK